MLTLDLWQLQRWQGVEQGDQPLGPGLAQALEVGVLLGDPVLLLVAETLFGIEQQIQRQADREVAAQGGVHGDQSALHGLLQRTLMA